MRKLLKEREARLYAIKRNLMLYQNRIRNYIMIHLANLLELVNAANKNGLNDSNNYYNISRWVSCHSL